MRCLCSTFLAVLLLAAPLVTAVRAETVELTNGDRLEGELLEQTDDHIVIEHPVLGRVEVPRGAIAPPPPPEPPKPPVPGLFGSPVLRGWKRNLAVGFSGSSGNSSDTSFNTALSLGREAENYRGSFESAYFFASKDGDRTTNEFYADYKHDFLFGESRFFLFATGRYDYDQFQSWENRVSASFGAGYDILRRSDFSLRGNIGGGLSRTWGTERKWKPEGVVGAIASWKISDGQTLSGDATYYPNFNDLPEFRLIANAAYTIAVGQIEGLGLKFGVKNEYNSETEGDNNNLKYYGNLAYEF